MPSDNLWGDLPLTKQLRTPGTILREQSAILESETDGLLIGRVGRQTRGETFDLLFNIVAPSLNNYSYEVLTVEHGIRIYPLKLRNSATGLLFECEDERAFEEQLKEILSSDHIHDVIIGLLSQVRGEI